MPRPLALLSILALSACSKGDLNLFTVEDDIELGQQLRDEILADPDTYPPLSRDDYPDAYAHLERIGQVVLDSGEVAHADDFEWEYHLIDDGETLNAFAAPGGYIWVYTGLLRFLEDEDAFAGVLGHEIAHAAQRHSTQQLTRIYGVSVLLAVVIGEDQDTISQIATGLAGLTFSREMEAEADDFAVQYLCDSVYEADGFSRFFASLEDANLPEFLSTHPSSETRVEDIQAMSEALGCNDTPNASGQWDAFMASLPPE